MSIFPQYFVTDIEQTCLHRTCKDRRSPTHQTWLSGENTSFLMHWLGVRPRLTCSLTQQGYLIMVSKLSGSWGRGCKPTNTESNIESKYPMTVAPSIQHRVDSDYGGWAGPDQRPRQTFGGNTQQLDTASMVCGHLSPHTEWGSWTQDLVASSHRTARLSKPWVFIQAASSHLCPAVPLTREVPQADSKNEV